MQKLEFEHLELGDSDSAHASICRVIPEGIREALGGNCGGRDEEAMDGEGVDGKVGVEGAEAVDIVDHGEEKRRCEGGVFCETVKVVQN